MRGWRRRWRGPLAAGLLAAALAGCGVTPEQEARAIEEGIMENPANREMWQAIKANYPDDFARLITRLQALPAAQKRNEAAVTAASGRWMIEFQEAITPDALADPRDQLLALGDANLALFKALQRAVLVSANSTYRR